MEKILLVEDERSISMVLKVYLRKAGYAVEQAFNGRQAVSMFTEGKPSLVILDLMLPDMDGFTVLRWIREQNHCPVVILSALNSDEYIAKGLNAGADEYICKPFDGEKVVERVREILNRRGRLNDEENSHCGR
jgi:DNA-binding response OmpR family regulator